MKWFLISTSLFLGIQSYSQVELIFETGLIVEGAKFQIKDSWVTLDATIYSLDSVLLLNYYTIHYTFPFPDQKKKKTNTASTESTCDRASLFAQKYGKVLLSPYENLDPKVTPQDSTEWRACFFERLEKENIDPFSAKNPLDEFENEAIKYDSTMIVMRTGDTVSVAGPVFQNKQILRYQRVGVTVDKKDVLMLLTPLGQKVFHARTGKMVMMKPQISELNSCAYGLLYARIYWDIVEFPNRIEGLEKSLTEDDEFSYCFYSKQEKLLKGKRALKTAGTIGSISRGAQGGLK